MPNDGGGAGAVTLGDNQNQNAGGNDGASNSSGGASGVDLTGFLSALDGDNRQFVEKGGWKDLNAIVKSHREAAKHISTTRNLSKGGSSGDEPVVPTSPEGYEFKLPEKLPSENFYDKNLAQKFSKWAHKMKLDTSTAQGLHDLFVTDVAEMVQASTVEAQTKMTENITKTYGALTKEWGGEETAAFKRNLELTRRAINNLGPDVKAALKEHGIIVDNNGQEVVANAAVALALGKVGAQMFAEDAIFGQSQTASENPFDPKKPNAKVAGELIKKDPGLARTLIQAAGPEAQADWKWWVDKTSGFQQMR